MHLAPLIQDLAIILGVAAVVTFLFKLIKQPVVLGYIVAGIIVGPYTPPIFSVVDVDSVKVWAELGVVFLMFSLGLEFSFRRLAKVGVSAGATAAFQIMTMVLWGYLAGCALGWSGMDAIFLGCMISISSTTIIIKALEELGLKAKRFAELVFGILIVEDLAAIVMLVALGSVATQSAVSGLDLLVTAGKLALVVGAWLVIGMFVVPRFIRAVARCGNDEMLVVVSLGLCLGLVSLAAYFHYSVALGAFIMGSILAETREAHRIEGLLAPLRDIFGAVFFVSVGMLLDPSILAQNFLPILVICVVIILGKILSVGFGALATGQTLSTSVRSGLSMAQIGEFSFIIATLGLTYKVIDKKLYPIIVASSLITTFTTPYLIRAAPRVTEFLDGALPSKVRTTIERYSAWFQRNSSTRALGRDFYERLARWLINAIVVITIFVVSAEKLSPWLEIYITDRRYARAAAWAMTFTLSLPFVWAMLTAFKRSAGELQTFKDLHASGLGPLLSRLATVLIVGLLSAEFFVAWVAVALTVTITALVFFAFRRQVEGYYRWFETTFVSGFSGGNQEAVENPTFSHAHLVPWDAHLAEIAVGQTSQMAGQTLTELQLRERLGTNVVVIRRADDNIVAPKATERILPGDVLLCFGTDDALEKVQEEMERPRQVSLGGKDLTAYGLRQISVLPDSPMAGRTIRESGIREEFDCMVVGIERDGQRIQSPKSDLRLMPSDRLWVVGESERLQKLQEQFRTTKPTL